MQTAFSEMQIERLIELVRQAASAEIVPRFRSLGEADISIKSDQHDLVTEADLATEAVLRRELEKVFPDALIVGEESVSADPSLRDEIGTAPLAIILDPVDGTWNFANGLPLFGVILAITVFGKPVFGMLYDPVVDDWVITTDEKQTHLVRADGQTSALSVSKGGDVSEMTGFIHFYLLPKAKQVQMGALLPNIGRSWSLRCSCHEYRLLAQGRAD
ncbi:MAG: inositol monophosphatase, partial [Pseudomonadota bacterium]